MKSKPVYGPIRSCSRAFVPSAISGGMELNSGTVEGGKIRMFPSDLRNWKAFSVYCNASASKRMYASCVDGVVYFIVAISYDPNCICHEIDICYVSGMEREAIAGE